MKNILTIDVEDYFQVENFKGYIKYEDWDKYSSNIVRSSEKILKALKKNNVNATFFVLGWIAERYPQLVRKIYNQGHEIATHGYAHNLIYKQTPQEFKHDLKKSIEILEKITGHDVLGYRAPAFSIIKDSMWALDIIKEEGLIYDASIYPIQGHDRYGIPAAKPYINKLNNGLYEIPSTTIEILNKRLPVAGGGYFRLYPYCLTKQSIRIINRKQNRPAVVYLHPWEFDSEQPRIKEATKAIKFRHYVNINETEKKFSKMLSDFEFTSIRKYLKLEENY